MNRAEFFEFHHDQITCWGHPCATKTGQVYKHRLVAESALCRYLKPEEIVHHHYNKDGSTTLVICQDGIYHGLLEKRTSALVNCGNVNGLKCDYCKKYDDPKNLSNNVKGIYHKSCNTKYNREWRRLNYE